MAFVVYIVHNVLVVYFRRLDMNIVLLIGVLDVLIVPFADLGHRRST